MCEPLRILDQPPVVEPEIALPADLAVNGYRSPIYIALTSPQLASSVGSGWSENGVKSISTIRSSVSLASPDGSRDVLRILGTVPVVILEVEDCGIAATPPHALNEPIAVTVDIAVVHAELSE